MYTRRHFNDIARILNEMYRRVKGRTEEECVIEAIMRLFATELSYHNPRFNRDKFLNACMGGE